MLYIIYIRYIVTVRKYNRRKVIAPAHDSTKYMTVNRYHDINVLYSTVYDVTSIGYISIVCPIYSGDYVTANGQTVYINAANYKPDQENADGFDVQD